MWKTFEINMGRVIYSMLDLPKEARWVQSRKVEDQIEIKTFDPDHNLLSEQIFTPRVNQQGLTLAWNAQAWRGRHGVSEPDMKVTRQEIQEIAMMGRRA